MDAVVALLLIEGQATPRPGAIMPPLINCGNHDWSTTACRLGCEGIDSKRLDSPCRFGRAAHLIKVKNPKAPGCQA